MSRPPPFQTSPSQASRTVGSDAPSAAGTWLVVGLVLLGLTAAATGIWFQWQQTRRCLDFYGPVAARRISKAPLVELLLLRPGTGVGRMAAHTRVDVSQALGLIHLRRGLVEDANFVWADGEATAGPPPAARLPAAAWDVALVFSESAAEAAGRTTLVIDFDRQEGALATVGQPGRIRLGRIGTGLEKWINSTLSQLPNPEKPGF